MGTAGLWPAALEGSTPIANYPSHKEPPASPEARTRRERESTVRDALSPELQFNHPIPPHPPPKKPRNKVVNPEGEALGAKSERRLEQGTPSITETWPCLTSEAKQGRTLGKFSARWVPGEEAGWLGNRTVPAFVAAPSSTGSASNTGHWRQNPCF